MKSIIYKVLAFSTLLLLVCAQKKNSDNQILSTDSTILQPNQSNHKQNGNDGKAEQNAVQTDNSDEDQDLDNSTQIENDTFNIDRFYSYWFNPKSSNMDRFAGKGTKGSLFVEGIPYDTFIGGINGLAYDESYSSGSGGLTGCALKFIIRDPFSDQDPFKTLFGIPLFLPCDQSNDSYCGVFRKLNPEIIDLAIEKLIPDPQTGFLNYTYQDFYNKIFSRFFRLMCKTYHYLHSSDVNINDEIKGYQSVFGDTTLSAGTVYLENRYGKIDFNESEIQSVYYLKPSGSIGFWLRRAIDGSDDQLWNALSMVMRLYDSAWFSALCCKDPDSDPDEQEMEIDPAWNDSHWEELKKVYLNSKNIFSDLSKISINFETEQILDFISDFDRKIDWSKESETWRELVYSKEDVDASCRNDKILSLTTTRQKLWYIHRKLTESQDPPFNPDGTEIWKDNRWFKNRTYYPLLFLMRSNKIIETFFNQNKDLVSHIKVFSSNTKDWQLFIDELLAAHERIVNTPKWKSKFLQLLNSNYNLSVANHFYDAGFPQHPDDCYRMEWLWGNYIVGDDHGTEAWMYGFWIRRFQEGNMSTVFKILQWAKTFLTSNTN